MHTHDPTKKPSWRHARLPASSGFFTIGAIPYRDIFMTDIFAAADLVAAAPLPPPPSPPYPSVCNVDRNEGNLEAGGYTPCAGYGRKQEPGRK